MSGDLGDESVLVWNGLVARVPPLVVRVASLGELVRAVRLARDHGLSVRLARGGGGLERAVTVDVSGMSGEPR